MHRLRAPRPALKRPVRRTAERIERARAEFGRQRVDDAPAPAVERIGAAVLGFRRSGERRPAAPTGKADERDRRDVGELAVPLVVVEREGAVRGEAARSIARTIGAQASIRPPVRPRRQRRTRCNRTASLRR